MIHNIATIDIINLALEKLSEIKYNDMNNVETKVIDAKNTLITYREKLQKEIEESDKWAKEQSEIHDMLELESEITYNQSVKND